MIKKLMLFILLPLFASSQYLETTIEVARFPVTLEYNDIYNKVYCGLRREHNNLIVINSENNQIIRQVEVSANASNLLFNRINHNLYYNDITTPYVTIIDGRTDEIITRLETVEGNVPMVLDTVHNILYTGSTIVWIAAISIIDCNTDSVIRILYPHDLYCYDLAWNPVNNEIYGMTAAGRMIIIVSGITYEIIGGIYVAHTPRKLLWHPGNYCLYVTGSYHTLLNDTLLICRYREIIDTLEVGRYINDMELNLNNNRLYLADFYGNEVIVVDTDSNEILSRIRVGDGPIDLLWNSMNDKLYCANYRSNDITIIDCESDTVIKTIMVGSGPYKLCWNWHQNRVYVANYNEGTVSVLRDSFSGIDEQENSDLKMRTLEISPNPAKTVIRVRVPWANKGRRLIQAVKIFDVSGKLVKEIASPAPLSKRQFRNNYATSSKKVLGRNDKRIEISLKGINPGIYFLQFGKTIKKFLVVR
ncbi:MAG: hypothetical protein OEW70_08680 [candidate division WOR-3 bacterium]|nr:hypothetical protein [candidate division WOR-3 bacterium]